MRKAINRLVPLLLAILLLSGCTMLDGSGLFGSGGIMGIVSLPTGGTVSGPELSAAAVDLSQIPAYSGDAYTTVNENRPYFRPEELSADGFESYSELDGLNRCGPAFAVVCLDIMPTGEREPIGMIKPSGWHTVRYDDLVDGKYLYNRCHLIGYQLSAENANEKNLITGTRYLNIQGMLPFENMVADYVKETEHHVAYRATPVFEGDELLARGVLLEGWSVEDQGEGICFCVFVYNVQPGIEIDYATGDSRLAAENSEPGQTPGNEPPVSNPAVPDNPPAGPNTITYIANTNTKRFHYPDCSSVTDINESNKLEYTGTAEELIDQGYSPCQRCKPS